MAAQTILKPVKEYECVLDPFFEPYKKLLDSVELYNNLCAIDYVNDNWDYISENLNEYYLSNHKNISWGEHLWIWSPPNPNNLLSFIDSYKKIEKIGTNKTFKNTYLHLSLSEDYSHSNVESMSNIDWVNIYKEPYCMHLIKIQWTYLVLFNLINWTALSSNPALFIDSYTIAAKAYFKSHIWPELTAYLFHPCRMHNHKDLGFIDIMFK